jgi:hypothetical protein
MGVDANRPGGLHAGGRIGTAKSRLSETTVLDGAHVALPDVKEDERGRAPCSDRKIHGRQILYRIGLELAKQAVHVDTAWLELEAAIVLGGNRERCRLTQRRLRDAAGPDGIDGLLLDSVLHDLHQLIPIGVQLDTTLLHQHSAVVLLRTEGKSGEVAVH